MSCDGSGVHSAQSVQSEADLSRSSEEVADLKLQESKVSKRDEEIARIIRCHSQTGMSPEQNVELELKSSTPSEDTPILQETPKLSQDNRETAPVEVEGPASQDRCRPMALPKGNSPPPQFNRSMSIGNRIRQDSNRLISEITQSVSKVRSRSLLKSNSKTGKANRSLSKVGSRLLSRVSRSIQNVRNSSASPATKLSTPPISEPATPPRHNSSVSPVPASSLSVANRSQSLVSYSSSKADRNTIPVSHSSLKPDHNGIPVGRTRSLQADQNMIKLKRSMLSFNHLQTTTPSLAEIAFQEFVLSEDIERSVLLSNSLDISIKSEDSSKKSVDTPISKEVLPTTSDTSTSKEISQALSTSDTWEIDASESKLVGEVSPVDHLQLSREELDSLGISVHYLSNQFMTEVRDAGHNETAKMCEIEDLEKFKIHGVIRKKGSCTECPIDDEVGAAYVHSVADMDAVGKASIMISYARCYSIGDILDTIVGYCKSEDLDPEKTYVWIYCLCSNQHRVVEKRKEGENTPFNEFRTISRKRISNIGHILAVLAPWQAPTYLSRMWCLFEIFMASERACKITIRMPSSQWDQFKKAIRCDNGAEQVSNIFKACSSINVRMAETNSDRTNIMRLIEGGGGYDNFNSKINGLIKEWVLDIIERIVDAGSNGANDNDSKVKQGSLLNVVSEIYFQLREVDRSLTLGKQAVTMNKLVHGRWHKETAKSLFLVGIALYWKFEFDASLLLQKEALAIRKKVLGRDDGDTAESIVWMAKILKDNGEEEEAMKMHKDALDIRKMVFGWDHAKTAESLNEIAVILEQQGDYDKTLELYNDVVEVNLKVYGRDHLDTAKTILNIALVLNKTDEKEEALKMFKESFTIFEKVLGIDHDYTAYTRDEISRLSKEIAELYLNLIHSNS